MRQLRIGLYVSQADNGVGRYLRDLVEVLPAVGPPHEYFLYGEASVLRRIRGTARVHHRIVPDARDRGAVWRQIQVEIPLRASADRIDLLHTHAHCLPVGTPCRTVVTLHDAIPVLTPRQTLWHGWRRTAGQQLRVATRLADQLIVSSRYTQRLLIERLRISPRKVTQIYLGCPQQFGPTNGAEARRWVRQRFGLHRPYLLSVGPLIPRKNHPMLIQAFRRRTARTHDLVIVGQLWWWGHHVLRLIDGDSAIRYLGYVTDHALHRLYAGAEGLVYASADEGFGLPPLEAMACGTPVGASRAASIPEVVGDAGLLVEPRSVSRLADALETLIASPRLQETLRRRGLARARRFQWEATARQTLAVYERVVGQGATRGSR